MADKIKYLGQEGLRTLINKIADVSVISISKAQYDALTPAEKQDRTFCINDWTPDETLGGSYNGPIGEIISYMGTTAPNNFLVCDGSIYNISDYIDLANHINKHFGSFNFFGGDGTTTFAVPDLRGEFLRGSGTNGHADSGNGANVGVHQNGTQIPYIVGTGSDNGYLLQLRTNPGWNTTENVDSWKHTNTGRWVNYQKVSTGTDEDKRYAFTSRPTNTSVLYCIRYREAGNGGVSNFEDNHLYAYVPQNTICIKDEKFHKIHINRSENSKGDALEIIDDDIVFNRNGYVEVFAQLHFYKDGDGFLAMRIEDPVRNTTRINVCQRSAYGDDQEHLVGSRFFKVSAGDRICLGYWIPTWVPANVTVYENGFSSGVMVKYLSYD